MSTPLVRPSHRHPRIIALVRQGETLPHPPSQARPAQAAPVETPTPFAQQQAEQLQRQLQAMCVLSPALQRIADNARRHTNRGAYRHEVVVQDLLRHVVEPAAISLTAATPGQAIPWFSAYPSALRMELAERLATALELEMRGNVLPFRQADGDSHGIVATA